MPTQTDSCRRVQGMRRCLCLFNIIITTGTGAATAARNRAKKGADTLESEAQSLKSLPPMALSAKTFACRVHP